MSELFALAVFVLMVGYIGSQIKLQEEIYHEDNNDSDID